MLNFTSRLALLCLLGTPFLAFAAQAQDKPEPAASQADLTLPMPPPLPLAPEALRGDSTTKLQGLSATPKPNPRDSGSHQAGSWA